MPLCQRNAASLQAKPSPIPWPSKGHFQRCVRQYRRGRAILSPSSTLFFFFVGARNFIQIHMHILNVRQDETTPISSSLALPGALKASSRWDAA